MQLLDMEKELAGPDGRAALAKYDSLLVSLEQRLDQALKDGLPQQEYARAAKLMEAVPISRKLLRLATGGRTES